MCHMEKIVATLLLLSCLMYGQSIDTNSLEKNCLSCHQKQQIPSSLIYKRYLMKYSTNAEMEKAMFRYLEDPKKENSIMPPQFFLKFPMRKKVDLDEETLRSHIRMYLKKFDVKQYLILDK